MGWSNSRLSRWCAPGRPSPALRLEQALGGILKARRRNDPFKNELEID
jgi:hypothetical protein